MARIRTLKPEFWDSPSTARADLAVRLTFMAMWNWADDSGHGTANVKELEAFVFPNDEVTELPRRSSRNSGAVWPNFAAILHEVAEVYGVVFYRVKGRPYYRIPSFNEHQAKHYRKESRYPQPEEGEIIDVTSGYAISSTGQAEAQDPVNVGSSRNSGASSRKSGIGTGEQGNRGTGEQSLSRTADADAPDDTPDPEPEPSITEQFDWFWSTYPRKDDKKKAREAFNRAVKRADAQTIVHGAAKYRDDPNREDAFTKYPATWLNADAWGNGPLPQRTPPQQFQSASERRYAQGMDLMAKELAEYEQQRMEIES